MSASSSNGIGWEFVEGDELSRRLEASETEVFRYRSNRPGFTFLMALAGILVIIAAWIYTDGITTSLSIGVFSLFVTTALALSSLVGYWTYFASVHFLAITPDVLIIGRGSRAHCLQFTSLSPQRLGLHNLDATSTQGVLTVNMSDTKLRLHLFNPFAYVDNLEGFMFHLLSRMNEHKAS